MSGESIIVTRLPKGTSKAELLQHFEDRNNGGDTIDYILHPFVNDPAIAAIKFHNEQVTETVVLHRHKIRETKIKVKPLPRQSYSQCMADVDPLIVIGIHDLTTCMDMLRTQYKVKVTFDEDADKLTLTGSMLQLQCAQSKLTAIYRKQQELQQRELNKFSSGAETYRSVTEETYRSMTDDDASVTYNGRVSHDNSGPDTYVKEIATPRLRASREDPEDAVTVERIAETRTAPGGAPDPVSQSLVLEQQKDDIDERLHHSSPGGLSNLGPVNSHPVPTVQSASLTESPFLTDSNTVDAIFGSESRKPGAEFNVSGSWSARSSDFRRSLKSPDSDLFQSRGEGNNGMLSAASTEHQMAPPVVAQTEAPTLLSMPQEMVATGKKKKVPTATLR